MNIPVIKDLASKHVSSDAPAIRPTLLFKPVMAYRLFIEVVDFVARVVAVGGCSVHCTQKEALGSSLTNIINSC